MCIRVSSNAYFQSDPLDRLLLLKPPKTGIPDQAYADGETLILARVPFYGQGDAGRKFWKCFRKVITDNQFRENQIAKATYVIEENNEVKAILITHVGDLCWAIMPGYEQHIDKILEEFVVNDAKIQEGEFRFCGKEIKQLPDKSIHVRVL